MNFAFLFRVFGPSSSPPPLQQQCVTFSPYQSKIRKRINNTLDYCAIRFSRQIENDVEYERNLGARLIVRIIIVLRIIKKKLW